LSAKTLKDMGLSRVDHIDTGFSGWVEAGLPIVDYETWRTEAKNAEVTKTAEHK